jgi:hypothetical protein
VDSLGLLMMTGISPLSMLISKGTGKLSIGLMLIISQFPFVLLSVTLGGVTIYQVISIFVTLIAYMIMMNNLALMFSVIFKRTSTAAGIMFAVVAGFNILVPIWGTTRWLSPFYRIGMVLQTFSKEPVWDIQATTYIALSVLFFVTAYLLFNTFCTAHTEASSAVRMPKGIRHAKWNLCRIKRTWKNAIAWKTFYFNVGGKYAMVMIQLILLLILVAVILFFKNFNPYSSIDAEDIGVMIFTTALIALFVEGIYISDGLFHAEVWGNTLSTLLTIPQTLKAIAYKKILGGLLITIPTIIYAIFGILLIGHNFFDSFDEPEFWGVILICTLSIIFYYHLVVLFSVLMKYGGFVIAFFVHGIIYALIAIPIAILTEVLRFRIPDDFLMVLTIFLYIPMIIALHLLIGKKIKKVAS